MNFAVPFSALAVTSCTPSTASRASVTVFSQCEHIMPSMRMVTSMSSSSSSTGAGAALWRRGLSLLALYILKRLSLSALDTTQKELRLIAAAPSIGLSVRPAQTKQPAAMGMPMVL